MEKTAEIRGSPLALRSRSGATRRWKVCSGTRTKVTSIGSAFQKIPFDNLQQAHVNELRATAQQSRLSMLAEANVSDHQKYASYLEFDFLGAAPTANSNESNSYTPRLRQFYLHVATTTATGGTSWPANRGASSRCSSRA